MTAKPRLSDRKVSVITTERNEAGAIRSFLDSLTGQSLRPDEVVIADAASTDDTVAIIKEYKRQHSWIKLVNAPGNRSVGRNAAIAAASHDIIAVTDVGCRLDKDWLRNITRPFSEGAEVVSGMFEPEPQSFFERVSTTLMLENKQEIDLNTWLPSSRSIAFTKAAWEKAGRYPEYEEFGNATVARLCGGEDTLYDLQLRQAGYRFYDGLSAVVYWRPRPNIWEFFKQYRMYSIGDGIRLVDYRHFGRLTLWSIVGLAGLIAGLFWLPLLFVTLLIMAWRIWRRVYPKWRRDGGATAFLLMVALIITYDMAQIAGFWVGYYYRQRLAPEKRMRFEA